MGPYYGAAGAVSPPLAGVGVLAGLGLQALVWTVAVLTLVFAALALVKLVPPPHAFPGLPHPGRTGRRT
ncbi:hypothetical protein ABZ614_05765 [Streptomyces sp. NPDC013178]|uniref:hypothetical protein n=1 Tax=unclassified Streptomyces TaxID=2593676 RepID=UPI0033C41C0E